jgi:hypothetical protein
MNGKLHLIKSGAGDFLFSFFLISRERILQFFSCVPTADLADVKAVV